MALSINTNIASLNAQRNYSKNASGLSRSLQRLSSGLRVNSAADDAAGLAISERMTTQVRGLNQATRNANDGVSMMQVMEGALSSMTELLQRGRELAVQAANGTNSITDRDSIQAEIEQLVAEIDKVALQTNFNGIDLLNEQTLQIANLDNKLEIMDGLKAGVLAESEKLIEQYYGLKADGATLRINLLDTDSAFAAYVSGSVGGPKGYGENLSLNIEVPDFVPATLPNGGTAPQYNDRVIAHEMVHAVHFRTINVAAFAAGGDEWFLEGSAEFIHGGDERLAAAISASSVAATVDSIDTNGDNDYSGEWTGSSQQYASAYAAVRYMHDAIKTAGGNGVRDIMEFLHNNAGSTLDDAITNASSGAFANQAAFEAAYQTNGATFITNNMNLTNEDTGAIGGLDADGGLSRDAESVISDVTNPTDNPLAYFTEEYANLDLATATSTLSFHVGANANQTILATKIGARASSLGLSNVNASSKPTLAITQFDRAINFISSERARIGALLSRMESASAVAMRTSEDLSASRSRVQDADYAAETANLSKSQILSQVATSIISQANALPQNVLQLLS